MKNSIRISLILKTFIMFISLHCNTVSTKVFVTPTTGDGILPLLKKLGNTLDERRASIGEIILTGTNITAPGLYVLGKDLDDRIVIDTDDVWLDLNGYEVFDSDSSENAVKVVSNHKNITITNGSLRGTGTSSSSSGILIEEGSKFIHIESVRIQDFNKGLFLDGSSTGTIKSCTVRNTNIKSSNKGVVLDTAIKNYFQNCTAYNCVEAGFELEDSELNVFQECKALETENDDALEGATGFSCTSGTGNIFYECVAQGTKKTNSNFCKNATGFLLKGTSSKSGETKTEIVNCVINGTEVSGNGNAYGIHLDAVLKSVSPLASPILKDFGDDILDVAWSPESKFIALCGNDDKVKVLEFDGTNVTSFTTTIPGATDALTLDWSPKGDFLSVGIKNDVGGAEFFVYRFDPHALDVESILVDEVSEEIGIDINSLKWSPCGRYIALGTKISGSIDEIQIWGFDGTSLTLTDTYNPGSEVKEVSFSPDGKYLAIAYLKSTDNIEVLRFNPLSTDILDPLSSITATSFSEANLNSIDWSPIACNSKYFIAVGGSQNNSTSIEVLTFNETTLISTDTADHGATITKVKWSPNGKYILVTGAEGSDDVEIFSFDDSATGSKIVSKDTEDMLASVANSGDWSPNGRYIITVGSEGTWNTAIFEVANVPTKCSIKYNKICNTLGGLCGIGVEGASGNNLIIRNVGYENDINFSRGIFNKFKLGLNGTPTVIENISVPPYED